MRRPAFMTSARVAASAAVALAFGALGCASSQQAVRASPWRIANHGVTVEVRSPQQLALLRRATVDPDSLHLLARRQGIGVFTAQSTGPGRCFLSSARRGFGLTVCGSSPFPSARLPAVDLSTLAAKAGDRHPWIVSLVGIAADGVARVAVRFVSGPAYSIPVIANTYIDRHVPKRRARIVVAFDRRGHQLISFSLPVPRVR